MKASFFLLVYSWTSLFCSAQKDPAFSYPRLDTIESYTNITISAGPDGYRVNDRKIDKRTYDAYKRMMDKAGECKPCWLKDYTIDGELVSEGVYYGAECRVGVFYEYYPAGRLKSKGQYRENNTGDWQNFYERGYCSVRDGTWLYYNDTGLLVKKEQYRNGKLVD